LLLIPKLLIRPIAKTKTEGKRTRTPTTNHQIINWNTNQSQDYLRFCWPIIFKEKPNHFFFCKVQRITHFQFFNNNNNNNNNRRRRGKSVLELSQRRLLLLVVNIWNKKEIWRKMASERSRLVDVTEEGVEEDLETTPTKDTKKTKVCSLFFISFFLINL